MSRHRLPCRHPGHEMFVGFDDVDQEFYGLLVAGGRETLFGLSGTGAIDGVMDWVRRNAAMEADGLARLRESLLADADATRPRVGVERTTDWRLHWADQADTTRPN